MRRQPLSRSSCARKRARGNVFRVEGLARKLAARVRLVTGRPVEAFRCHWCHKWHLGKAWWKKEYQR